MTTTERSPLPQLVTLDLYRDIHKAIRVELFTVTAAAGRVDPSDRGAKLAVAEHVAGVVELLVAHAEHEDGAIQPTLEAVLPVMAEHVEIDHLTLDARLHGLEQRAYEAADARAPERLAASHGLYLELASFTSAYLAHQDFEERTLMPALEAAVGIEAVVGMHQAILAGIPPEEMAATLSLMLPAMNLDDRVEMLGGMRAGAPAEVFEGVWALAGSVLLPGDHAALAQRLDLA